MAYYVYMMASESRVLYTGFSSDLIQRVWQHKAGLVPGFTSQYRVKKLIYFETYDDPKTAIAREKQLKRWPRERKARLIERHNPEWRDLTVDWPEFSR